MRGVSDAQIAQAIGTLISNSDALYARINGVAARVLWCLRKLEHPAIMEAIETGQMKDPLDAPENQRTSGIVTPPNAGEIVITG